MAKEPRPKGYPKLKNYKPSQFMLPTSRYDKKKADRAVTFIENLCHTKGKWAGTPFWLLPWQEQLIRDIFGIVKPDGNRQFRTAFVEICKKVGKSELAAAVALYLLYADNEPSAEVYGAAADRQQASIVFDVAKQMVEMSPALMKRSKLMGATKRIVNYRTAMFDKGNRNDTMEAIDHIIPFLKGDADMIGLVCNTIRKLFCMSDEGYETFLMDLEDYKSKLEEEE